MLQSHGACDVVTLRPPTGVLVAAESTDLGLRAAASGPGRFTLSGVVGGEQDPALQLWLDGEALAVPLSRGMAPMAVFHALEKCLPVGMVASAHPDAGWPGSAVVVTVHRGVAPAARLPQVEVLIHDSSQRARSLATNSFELSGTTAHFGPVQPSAEVGVDGRHLHVTLGKGMNPGATARAISSALPAGYTAIVEPPRPHGAPVIVTVVRCSDLNVAAA
ncbi:MAG: hypothetical protein HYZ28_15605 [Myxococcales bacterium]|nr:hypothetical protein [Myxococcales bacterium]